MGFMGENHFRGGLLYAGYRTSASVFEPLRLLLLLLLLTLLIGRRGKSLIIFRAQNACHSAKRTKIKRIGLSWRAEGGGKS